MTTTEDRNTTNAAITKAFFRIIAAPTKRIILTCIADHYGISTEEAFDEVTNDEAEDLCDYLTGSTRTATSALMQRHGLR